MAIDEFSQLTAEQIRTLPKDKTVFFFSVGPLEDHGPHLPIGMDVLMASRSCVQAATYLEENLPGWRGVLMPALSLGIDSNTTELSITVRPHVLRDWLVDACMGLIQIGFFHFVCFSGHPGPKQLTAIEDAGKLIRKRMAWRKVVSILRGKKDNPTLISANSALISFNEVITSPFWPDPEEHGGQLDTSIALSLFAEMKETTLPDQVREPIRYKRNWLRRRHKLQGYWGKPSEARADLGQQYFDTQIAELFPRMRSVWEGNSNPDRLFRSWYSILPFNKSFFKAWILAFWICILMMGYLFLRGAALQL